MVLVQRRGLQFLWVYLTRRHYTTLPTDQLEQLHALVSAVNATASTTEKRSLLLQYPSCHGILTRIYDPHRRHFVSSKTVQSFMASHDTSQSNIASLGELLDALSSRKITGHGALGVTAAFYKTFCQTDATQQVFWRVIDRNLKMGVSVNTVQALLSDKAETKNKQSTRSFPGVALAMTLCVGDEARLWSSQYTVHDWFVSRKLDGVRCIARVDEHGQVQFYSRTGRPFDTLDKIAKAIQSRHVRNCVLDGEICVYNADKEDFLTTLSQIRRGGVPMPNPVFDVFDCIDLDEFYAGHGSTLFRERQARLNEVIGAPQCHLRTVRQVSVSNPAQLAIHWQHAAEYSWEGLVLRNNVGYQGKRSRHMLKLKAWEDAEYVVKAIETSWMRMPDSGKEQCVLSNVMIEHKGHEVRVGSGFSLDQRIEFASQPNAVIGKIITVRYFAESINERGERSLRFPTVKAVFDSSRD